MLSLFETLHTINTNLPLGLVNAPFYAIPLVTKGINVYPRMAGYMSLRMSYSINSGFPFLLPPRQQTP